MSQLNLMEMKQQLDEIQKANLHLTEQLKKISSHLSNDDSIKQNETPIVKKEDIVPYVKPIKKDPFYSSSQEFYLNFVKHVIKNIDLNDDPSEHQDRNNLFPIKKREGHLLTHNNCENDINYFDEILTGDIINKLFDFSIREPRIKHKSSTEKDEVSFYQVQLMNNMYFHKLFYEMILPNLNIKNKENLIIDRVYYNIHTFGLPGNWHTDGRSTMKYGPSILIYCNPTWTTKWEGATAYYINKEKLEMKYVDVKPGRIVVASPTIEHRATDMSGYAYMNNVERVTLAFHTIYM